MISILFFTKNISRIHFPENTKDFPAKNNGFGVSPRHLNPWKKSAVSVTRRVLRTPIFTLLFWWFYKKSVFLKKNNMDNCYLDVYWISF